MTSRIPMGEWTAEELLERRAWLHALAERLVRDEAAREDLVQEALLAAWRAEGGWSDPRRWLGAVLRLKSRFAKRGEVRRARREAEAARPEAVPSAAALAEVAELQRVVAGAVLALEEPYRSTVLQRYFGGLSAGAIARREGVPAATVRSRLKRALERLRAELERRTGGEQGAWAVALVPLVRKAGAPVGLVAASAVLVSGGLLTPVWRLVVGAGAEAASTAVLPPERSTAVASGAEGAPSEALSPHGNPAARAPAPGGVAPSGGPDTILEVPALDPGGTLRGRVLDARDSRPLADVRIASGTVSTVSGVGGRFEMSGLLVGEPIELECSAAAHPTQRHFVTLASSKPEPMDIWLDPGVRFAGTVIDFETRMPIAGASLTDMGAGLELATSDAAGRFEVRVLPLAVHGFADVGVEPSEHLGVRLAFRGGDAEELEIPLVRPAVLEGRVRDPEGRPIADAWVWCLGADEAYVRDLRRESGSSEIDLPEEWRLLLGDPRARTDGDGHFRLDVLPWRVSEVIARLGDARTARATVEPLAPRASAAVALVLDAPAAPVGATGRVEGRLRVDGERRRGHVFWRGEGVEGDVRTGPGGSFTIETLAPGEVRLRARADDGGLWSEAAEHEERTLEVVAGETAEVVLDLSLETIAIRGHVYLPSGAPAPHHGVSARETGGWQRTRTETDARGAYALPVLAGCVYDLVSAHGPDAVLQRGVPAGAEGIDFHLEPFGSVRLRARDAWNARPLAVRWFRRRTGAATPWEEHHLGPRSAPDPQGFHHEELGTGVWELAAGAPESGYPLRVAPPVSVHDGGEVTVDLALERGVTLALVLDAPWTHGALELRAEEPPASLVPVEGLRSIFPRTLSLDGATFLSVPGLDPGAYALVSHDPGIVLTPARVLVGDSEVTRVALSWSRAER